MVVDFRSRQETAQADIEGALDEQVTELKTQADAAAQYAISRFEDYLVESYEAVSNFTESPSTDYFPEDIAFAQVKATPADQSSSGTFLGVAAISAAAIATAAYLIKNKQQKTISESDSLLNQDEEFVMV